MPKRNRLEEARPAVVLPGRQHVRLLRPDPLEADSRWKRRRNLAHARNTPLDPETPGTTARRMHRPDQHGPRVRAGCLEGSLAKEVVRHRVADRADGD